MSLTFISGLQEKLGQKDDHHFYLFKVNYMNSTIYL